MPKQKKRKEKENNKSVFKLSETQLRNRWIYASIGLILLFILIIALTLMLLTGKIVLPMDPQFASTNTQSDQGRLAGELAKARDEYIDKYDDFDYSKLYEEQRAKPKDGEEIAVIKFVGSNKLIKAKLFSEEVPEIVAQFKEQVKKGYYNNKEISGIKDKALESVIIDRNISWRDYSVKTNKVLPYNGALCATTMLTSDLKDTGVNFFIMNHSLGQDLTGFNIPARLKEMFKTQGGSPIYIANAAKKAEYKNINNHANLLDYLKHPTFGQVFEGLDLVKALTKSDKKYIIEKIEIVNFSE